MTLQTSGRISIADVKAEKDNDPSNDLQTLCTTNINPASAVQPSQAAPYQLTSFYGYDHHAVYGTIAQPTCQASFDVTTGQMTVSVIPDGTPPSNTTWTFTSSLGTVLTCQEPTRTVTQIDPLDGQQECWTVRGTAPYWGQSPTSANSCAVRGYLGTIATPSCVANWNFTTHQMDVSVTPNGAPPAGTLWTFSSSLGGSAQCTEPTRTVHVTEPEDGTLECWTVHGSAANWHPSAESTESCANRGNPQ